MSVIKVIPTVEIAPALIIVGIFMMESILDIDWKEFAVATVAF